MCCLYMQTLPISLSPESCLSFESLDWEGKDRLQSFHDCDVPRVEWGLKCPFWIFCDSIVFTVLINSFSLGLLAAFTPAVLSIPIAIT